MFLGKKESNCAYQKVANLSIQLLLDALQTHAEEIWAVGSWADREPAAGTAGLIQLSKFVAKY